MFMSRKRPVKQQGISICQMLVPFIFLSISEPKIRELMKTSCISGEGV